MYCALQRLVGGVLLRVDYSLPFGTVRGMLNVCGTPSTEPASTGDKRESSECRGRQESSKGPARLTERSGVARELMVGSVCRPEEHCYCSAWGYSIPQAAYIYYISGCAITNTVY